MPIIKRSRRDNFGIIPNHVWEVRRWQDRDGREQELSFLARSVLAYLLCRPHDWRVDVGHLRKIVGCGRDKAYGLIAELVACGYISREQARDPVSGQLGDYQLIVYDEPIATLPTDETGPKMPVPENQEAAADRFLISPLPENQEPDKERVYNKNSPLSPTDAPCDGASEILARVLSIGVAEAIAADRAAGGATLSTAEATTLAQHCARQPDPDQEAERLMATRYRGVRGLRRLASGNAAAARPGGLGTGAAALPGGSGITLVRAADVDLFSAAVAASGKTWLADARAGTFDPAHVEQAKRALGAEAGAA